MFLNAKFCVLELNNADYCLQLIWQSVTTLKGERDLDVCQVYYCTSNESKKGQNFTEREQNYAVSFIYKQKLIYKNSIIIKN